RGRRPSSSTGSGRESSRVRRVSSRGSGPDRAARWTTRPFLRLSGGVAARGSHTMSVEAFYDGLAPIYHLIYPAWEASIRRQAIALDSLIRQHWGEEKLRILDVACGIGTQALGLAGLGHAVTALDLSPAAVERARAEAARRALSIDFSVADMRALPGRF